MVKNNSLPPASQPWVRELEKRIKNLERETSATHSRVNHLKNVTSSPKLNLDSLTVGELKVGGDPVVIPFLTGAGLMGWSVSGGTVVGNRISSTGGPITVSATMPDLNIEGGFVMEWALEASASVDSIRVTNSIDPLVEDAEPNNAMADEVSTYYASAGYNLGDIEGYVPEPGEEVRPPVPVMVSFTFTNPEPGPFSIEIISSKASYTLPGQGGIQVTPEGDVLIVDSDGDSHPLRELSEAEAQAIVETAENLEQAQQDLEDARVEAEQNFGILDDKLGQAFPGDNIFDVDLAIEQAKQLAEQQFNDSITGTVVEYSRNSNETNPPVTGWSTTPPTRDPGTFIWMRTTVSYGSGDSSTTDPVLLTGNAGIRGPQGPQGPEGPQGVQGPDGPQGQALYTWIKYAPNGNPSSAQMSESPVDMTHMGIAHNQTVQTEGTDPSAYTWSLIKGPQGNTGIQGPDGEDGQSLYTWVKYAPNGSPTSGQITDTPQATSTHIGLAYNKPTASETTVPGDYTWSLIKGDKGERGPIGLQGPQGPEGEKGDRGSDGIPGDDGKGIKSTAISYARSTSGASAPASGWQEQPPTPIKGQYLWTRTIWTYTDDATETGYSSAYWANDGAKGNDGAAGKHGTTLTGTVQHYAQSTSGVTPPTSGWATQPPTAVPGRYMWTRSTWSYSDGTTEEGYTVGKIGDTGAKGDKGDQGPQGVPGTKGADGTQYYTWLKYAPNGSPTSAQMTDVPNTNSTHMGMALNQTSSKEGTDPSAYTWSLIKGTDGVKGDPGADGSSLYTWVKYAPNGTPTNAQITDLPQSNSTHIGLAYNKTTATESTSASAYTWTLIQGPKGDEGDEGEKGDQGVSVESITPHFRRLADSVAKPAKPSGMTPSGWVATEPDYVRDTTMWRSDRIVFSNDQITWTDVSKSSSYEAAKEAEKAALSYAEDMRDVAIQAGAHDLANLQIGGRNFILNSAQPGLTVNSNNSATAPMVRGTDEIGRWVTGTQASTGEFHLSTYITPGFEGGRGDVFSEEFFPMPDVYTQSMEVMADTAMTVRLGLYGAYTVIQPNEWTKISVTTSNPGTLLSGPRVDPDPNVPVGTKFYYRNWKLEKGTKSTGWTPAPEDVDAGIAGAIDEAAITAQEKADAAKQAAIDAAKAELDALEVGGRNLIKGSGTPYIETNQYRIATYDFGDNPPQEGETITVSIKGELGPEKYAFGIYNSGGSVSPGTHTLTSRGADGVFRRTYQWRVGSASNTFVAVYQLSSSSPGPSTIEWIKVERGSKSTDWTPAPEDVDAGIADAKADASTAVQRANAAVKDTKIEYAVNTSETTAPTSGWSTSTPTRSPGSYIWMRTTITYGDGTPAVLSPVLVTGNDGAKGSTGSTGGKGDKGDPGSVITSSVVEYAQSTSGTTKPTSWSTTVPSPTPGRYIWTRTTFKYTVGADQYSYSVGKIGETGGNGAPGGKGEKGDPGTTLTGTTLHYTQTTSGTTIPSSGWATTIPSATPGRYMWTRTTWSFSDKPDQYGYSVALNGATGGKGATGDPGSDGADGISVTSVTPFYRQAASKPGKPSGMTPSGWATTEPEYAENTSVWRSDRVVYSNALVDWTDVSKSSSYEAAKAVKAELDNLQIGGRNLLKGTSDEWETTVRPAGNWFFERGSDFAVVPGETYTFSIEVEKVTEDEVPINLHLGFGSAAGIYSWDLPNPRGGMRNNMPFGEKVSLTFTVLETDGGANRARFFAFRLRNERLATTIRFRNAKLERGNRATDWSPAPEDAQAGIDAAINMASGKNAASYTDVADSVAAPGPTPSTSIGDGRRVHDMHRNRRSNGQIIGEWIWTGTAWTQLKLSDAMLSSLDVGLLSAGGVRSIDAVIQNLWVEGLVSRAATFSRATVAAQNLIPGIDSLSQYGSLTTEEKNASPFREFGVNTGHPSLSVTGRSNVWIWANIRVRAGERYRITLDGMSPITGAQFSIQTRRASSDGGQSTIFSSWTDLKSSDNTITSASYPFTDTETRSSWTSYWSERTATADGVISFLVYANTASGTTNTGFQYFRNFTMKSMTDGNMLVDGAVTARTLNVVPETGTGGMELKPEGLRIIPSVNPTTGEESGSAISLRVGEPNWFSFAKGGASTFFVTEDGDMTVQNVNAQNISLGTDDLRELIESRALGVVSGIATLSENASVYTTMRGIMTVNFTNRTSIPRTIKVTAKVHARNRSDHLKAAFYIAKSTTNEGITASLGSTVGSESNYGTYSDGQNNFEHIQFIMNNPGETISVLLGIKTNNSSTEQIIFSDHNTRMWAEDLGPWSPLDPQKPDASGGSSGGTTPVKNYVWKRSASWVRSFLGNNSFYNYGAGRAYQGLQPTTTNGNLKSLIGFVSPVSALNGATITSIRLNIKNQHTYSSSGAMLHVGLHGYGSAPSTWGHVANDVVSSTFTRGQSRSLLIPSSYHSQFANGTIRGVSLYSSESSLSKYGYWDGTNAELVINYKK